MNQLQTQTTNEIARLESLAEEARHYAIGATFNMLQLGRVFIEAKKLLKHGEFAAWCDSNAGCSQRTAENMMSAYVRFGNKPEFTQIGKTKLFKMLTLPEGKEDQFIAENDIANMSSREVDQAIREVRGDAAAEKKETAKPEIAVKPAPAAPDETIINELRSIREERDRLAAQNKEMIDNRNRLYDEIRSLKDGSEQDNVLINDQQATIDSLNEELNRYRVAEARGDAGRNNGSEMNADAFRLAVHEFMGDVHQVPSMGSVFATMDNAERIVFDTLLKSVEAWCKGARKALDTIEGGFIV